MRAPLGSTMMRAAGRYEVGLALAAQAPLDPVPEVLADDPQGGAIHQEVMVLFLTRARASAQHLAVLAKGDFS